MPREARGEFLFMYYGDIRQLLHDAAISLGVKIRLGIEVTSIDPDTRRAKDVIVGADGVNGVTRRMVLEQELWRRSHQNNATMSTSHASRAPSSSKTWNWPLCLTRNLNVSYGSGGCVIAFPVGPDMQELAFEVYTGNDGNAREWGEEASAKVLLLHSQDFHQGELLFRRCQSTRTARRTTQAVSMGLRGGKGSCDQHTPPHTAYVSAVIPKHNCNPSAPASQAALNDDSNVRAAASAATNNTSQA
ncbi:hypothetical protein D9611_011720 [Ephemerocybe angulata]|uniref:FAD-binding domain-containing protein n=1 Tax=Ephemerocybe angulata TaxID=980116 RepID=A0A8H5FGB2_9AGAR|nr:hypothetical protein D9611_011720 [Tulosesus angulatus]